jgi:hypothetical protein
MVPEAVVKMMNLHELQSSSSMISTANEETHKSCCGNAHPMSLVVVKELESEEEFHQLLQKGEKLVVKFTARYA